MGYLLVAFTTIALRPVDDAVVVPYTAFVARIAGAVRRLFGEDITMAGCEIGSPRFAVVVYNGCNGLVTSLIFVAGVLAFPASWRAEAPASSAGWSRSRSSTRCASCRCSTSASSCPDYFDEAHILVWQSVVILAGVGLWMRGRSGRTGCGVQVTEQAGSTDHRRFLRRLPVAAMVAMPVWVLLRPAIDGSVPPSPSF